MNPAKQHALIEVLLSLVPADGTPIGNQPLRQRFIDAARAKALKATDAQFDKLLDSMVAEGVLLKGKGRGGSVVSLTRPTCGLFLRLSG